LRKLGIWKEGERGCELERETSLIMRKGHGEEGADKHCERMVEEELGTDWAGDVLQARNGMEWNGMQ
jgi:hypothetical protein